FHGVDPETLEQLGDPQPAAQERQEMYLDLAKVAASFSPYHREILHLRFGLGLSVAEVAERVGSNTENIRKLSNRVVARLRRRLLAASGSPAKDDDTGPED
ncbi:MAG TPA: sigma factor-like helix-turn-helix DNA-binding protein, partial [Thermoanaerobaculia bacterium]|nr:sigma factor-like helix-turn-helix DNA-binding protein [Thermoanaerobaculia bacterium]